MDRKVLKLISLVLMVFMVSFVMFGYIGESKATGLEEGASTFGKDYAPDAPDGTQEALDKGTGVIMTAVRIISSTIAIVTLMVLGIKYMTSAPGDRADIKKHAVVYVVGALLLFAVPGVIDILIKISENFSN